MKMAKKKSKNTVQDLIGIETFTKRGIKTAHGEPCLLPYQSNKYFCSFKRKYRNQNMAFNASAIGSA